MAHQEVPSGKGKERAPTPPRRGRRSPSPPLAAPSLQASPSARRDAPSLTRQDELTGPLADAVAERPIAELVGLPFDEQARIVAEAGEGQRALRERLRAAYADRPARFVELLSQGEGSFKAVLGGISSDWAPIFARTAASFCRSRPLALPNLAAGVVAMLVTLLKRLEPIECWGVMAAVDRGLKLSNGTAPRGWQAFVDHTLDFLTEGAAVTDLMLFCEELRYTTTGVPFRHQLFGHEAITLYPLERAPAENPHKVHRPTLDLELVGGKLYARCYLALFDRDTSGTYKDITADETGVIRLSQVNLMNLGNPFKALLWCEDYLKSKEHDKAQPNPVIRSFLIPLAEAAWMLRGDEVRVVDQDRGSGQFGNKSGGTNFYGDKLHPVCGSLVSFVVDPRDVSPRTAHHRRLPMSLLQRFLTGGGGDPRDMTAKGIAAQHGRKGHVATFARDYAPALEAYYLSLAETGFTDATQADEAAREGKYATKRSGIEKVDLTPYDDLFADTPDADDDEERKGKGEKSA